MMPTQYGNPAGAGSRVRRMDKEDVYLIHINNESNYLAHYGVKGQKWGVITKEYEPVAVDHRRTQVYNPVARARTRYLEREARQYAEDQKMREQRQEWIEKKNRRIEVAGKALGVGVLALSLFAGYKLSGIKISGKNALRSLLNIIPSKDGLKAAGSLGFMALMAKEQTSTSGLDKVKSTFNRSGELLKLQKYRRHLAKARDIIKKYSGSKA